MEKKIVIFLLLLFGVVSFNATAQSQAQSPTFLFFEPKKYDVISLSVPHFKHYARLYSSAFVQKHHRYQISLRYKLSSRSPYNQNSSLSLVCFSSSGKRHYYSSLSGGESCSIIIKRAADFTETFNVFANSDIFYIEVHDSTVQKTQNSFRRLKYYDVTEKGYEIWRNKVKYIVEYKNLPPLFDSTGRAFEGLPNVHVLPKKEESYKVVSPVFEGKKEEITPEIKDIKKEIPVEEENSENESEDYVMEFNPEKPKPVPTAPPITPTPIPEKPIVQEKIIPQEEEVKPPAQVKATPTPEKPKLYYNKKELDQEIQKREESIYERKTKQPKDTQKGNDPYPVKKEPTSSQEAPQERKKNPVLLEETPPQKPKAPPHPVKEHPKQEVATQKKEVNQEHHSTVKSKKKSVVVDDDTDNTDDPFKKADDDFYAGKDDDEVYGHVIFFNEGTRHKEVFSEEDLTDFDIKDKGKPPKKKK